MNETAQKLREAAVPTTMGDQLNQVMRAHREKAIASAEILPEAKRKEALKKARSASASDTPCEAGAPGSLKGLPQ